jgi:hypothetical protein
MPPEASAPVRALVSEQACYRRHEADLLRTAAGKFVLIRGGDVVGVYDSEKEALRCGFTSFGLAPFLVREVRPPEPRLVLVSVRTRS